MADASYRLNSEGKMYCSTPIEIGQMIMGKSAVQDTTYEVEIVKKHSDGSFTEGPFCLGDSVNVFFTGNTTGTEYIFEATGATFTDGGCKSTRSTLNGVGLTLTNSTVSVKAAYGACKGEPPF